jgi:2-methylcitrate dehydratase PrpD
MHRRPDSVLARLADWIVQLVPESVPGEVADVALTCLVDTIGVAVAGSRTGIAGTAANFARETAAAGAACLIGRPDALAAPAAAFANGCAAHALDFDDNCYAGFVHGSAVIVPAALAVAQALDASGSRLLTAVVAGAEAEYAIGAAATNVVYDKGWWTTGVLGPIGACAASAWLMGLDARQTANALGLAVAGTGGAKSCFGTDAKPLLAGRASQAGVVASILAASSASGPIDAIEHGKGFAHLFIGGAFALDRLGELGRGWHLLSPGVDVKRIPVCLSSHAAVDAVSDLALGNGIAADEIVDIVCDVPPIVVSNLIHDRPRTSQEAQFSMPYAIAVSLLFGAFKLEHLGELTRNDPAVQALMTKVRMITSAFWTQAQCAASPEGAMVSILLSDGRSYEAFRAFPCGAASDPLSPDQIDAKFLDCTLPTLQGHAEQLLKSLRELRQVRSVRNLPLHAGMQP